MKHDKQISFRTSEETYFKLSERALITGTTVGLYVRNMLTDALDNKNKQREMLRIFGKLQTEINKVKHNFPEVDISELETEVSKLCQY